MRPHPAGSPAAADVVRAAGGEASLRGAASLGQVAGRGWRAHRGHVRRTDGTDGDGELCGAIGESNG